MNFEVFKNRGYTGLAKLDSGGQGNVRKTVKNGVFYAIKVMHLDKKPDGSCKMDNDLKRELEIVSKLRHPNCIRVHELLRTSSKVYIVMDYAPNGNIGSVVRANGPLCEWNAKVWWCPVARAVRYLHNNRVAHR